MDILMIVESDFPPDIRLENEIKTLSNAGHNIVVICPTQDKNRVGSFMLKNVSIQRFLMSSFIYKTGVGQLKFPFYYNAFIRNISKILRKLDTTFDVLHVHDLSMAKIGLKFSNQLNTKLVLDLHENYPYLIKDAHHTQKGMGRVLSDYKKWIEFEKVIVKSFKNIIVVVDEMKHRMLSFDNRPDSYHVYQNVINSSDIQKYIEPKINEGLKLVYVGGITPSRGIQNVIKAIDQLPPEIKLEFNIYGKGIYLDHLIAMVQNLDISDKVIFKGFIQQNEVIKTIQEHNIAIIPHYRSIQNNNSSPNKLFQYMSTGRAIISSNCDSIERILRAEKAGLTYSDQSPEELASVLINLSKDPDSIVEMGKNGRDAVCSTFNTDVEGKRLSDFYQNLD